MIIGTFVFMIFKIFISILKIILFQPLFLIKVSFFWFTAVFAASYIFFLMIHQSDVAFVRKDMAIALAQSLGMGLIIACVIESLLLCYFYEVAYVHWFAMHQTFDQDFGIRVSTVPMVFARISLLMIFLSGFFAAHYVGQILDQSFDDCVSERYGWLVVAMTLLCCAFLWFVVLLV